MRVVFKVCCGLDVHKRTVTACLLKWGSRGKKAKEVRTFQTTTTELESLAEWLRSENCQHVAMESTGVYWKPVYNILEGVCDQILLVNAHHVKNVPGRKSTELHLGAEQAQVLMYWVQAARLSAKSPRTRGTCSGWSGISVQDARR